MRQKQSQWYKNVGVVGYLQPKKYKLRLLSRFMSRRK